MSGGAGILGTSWALLSNRNVRVFAVTGLVSGVYLGMLNGVLQLFPVSLGFSVAALGLLQAFGNRFSGIAASVVQPFAGHYADIQGRRRVIVLGSVTTISSMVLFVGAGVTKDWVVLFAAFVLFGVSTLGSPASQALLAESVEMDPRKMNVAYSLVFFLFAAPGVVTPYVAGQMAGVLGYGSIFVLAAGLESVDLYLYLKELSETRHMMPPGPGETGRGFSFRESLRLPKGFLGIFATLAFDSFAFGISSSIIYAIMSDAFGFDLSEVGLVIGVLSLAIIGSQYPATKLLLILGPRRTTAFSEFLGVVLMAGWALASTLPEFIALSVVFGVSVATWVPGVQSMLMASSPPRERGSIGGKVAAFRGLVAFPAPILGGLLYQSVGYQAPMLASFVGAVITVVMIWRLIPEANAGVPAALTG